MSDEREKAVVEELQSAYRVAFGSPAGQAVLADLAPYCCVTESCFDPDPRIHAMLEGKRAVWLRIQGFLNLTYEDLHQLALRRPRIKQGESDG